MTWPRRAPSGARLARSKRLCTPSLSDQGNGIRCPIRDYWPTLFQSFISARRTLTQIGTARVRKSLALHAFSPLPQTGPTFFAALRQHSAHTTGSLLALAFRAPPLKKKIASWTDEDSISSTPSSPPQPPVRSPKLCQYQNGTINLEILLCWDPDGGGRDC